MSDASARPVLAPLRRLARSAVLLALVVGVPAAQGAAASVGALRVIGRTELAAKSPADGVVPGGLSGLDYDAAGDRWLAVSDDKSEHGPARCHVLTIDYDQAGVSSAAVTGTLLLRRPDGSTYPPEEAPDFEALRIDPGDGSIWYADEGNEELGRRPAVRRANREGRTVADLPLPRLLAFAPGTAAGLRPNLALEGLAFAADGGSLWLAVEGPLRQDGPLPTLAAGALTRLTRLGRDGTQLAQYAYPLEPIALAPADGKLADNGVAEILALEEHRLLVLERSGRQDGTGRWHFIVRLFEADCLGATEVGTLPALAAAGLRPMSKRLLFDFGAAGLPPVGNLEGIAWGRPLANGHPTLVLVSDNNFSPHQATQLWILEVLPAGPARIEPPKPNWDDKFEGVVHDDRRIAGFVADYRWLSNYHPCPVTFEGRAYGSSEAAYHASKYPAAERDEFTQLDPDASKKLSRKKGVDQPWWDERKARVMAEILRAKFAQNPDLAAKLLATGDRHLEETNWWGDKFWGVCKGEGKNELGRILMEIRAELRAARPAGKI